VKGAVFSARTPGRFSPCRQVKLTAHSPNGLQFQNRTGKSACATKIPPGDIPLENRQAIFKDLKTRSIGVSMKIKKEKLLENQ
jgi:hypothetical protein